MGKVQFKKYNPSILRNAKLIRDSKGYMNTYLLGNGLIYKEVKREDYSLRHSLYRDDFIECLYLKLLLSSQLSDHYLVLPKTVYMDHDDVVGYTVPFVNMASFEDFLRDCNDLDFITDSFVLLSQAVKDMNREGIIFPDLGNASNIFYDPYKRIIKFIDFDGLQVGNCDSFNVSLIMSDYDNPVFDQKKYFDRNTVLYSSNFDKATLLTLFLYYTTGTILTRFNSSDFLRVNGEYSIKRDALDYYLLSTGLLDSPLEEDINLVYDNNKNNNYLETGIKRLRKTHRLCSPDYTFRKI